jgi:hypothetical protein
MCRSLLRALPDSISPYLAALMVRDMLNMPEGQDADPTCRA